MRIAIALAVSVTLAHGDAHADVHADTQRDAIARARALEAKLAYDEALVIVEAAIAAGGADPAQLVELHLLAGRLGAGLDRTAVAEAHFAIVLALDPARVLPDDVSPKISVPFTRARTRTARLAPKLVVTEREVAIEDGGALVAGIALRLRDGSAPSSRSAPRIARPASPLVEVRALDRSGNTLWIARPPAEPTSPARAGGPHLLARWSTWAAVTGVALAGAGVAAWRFRVADDDFATRAAAGADYTELHAIEDRAERWALVTNVSLGIAAATAITSVIFLVRRPSSEPAITVTAGPGSLGVAGRF